MDTLREEEDTEVNHHGKAIDVGTDTKQEKTKINTWIAKTGTTKLFSVNEELQQRAIRNTIQYATNF
jgi:phosphoribosylformimino-5-aminoimidazole carboxamide ribonucleotide (ProFAR) isomerase